MFFVQLLFKYWHILRRCNRHIRAIQATNKCEIDKKLIHFDSTVNYYNSLKYAYYHIYKRCLLCNAKINLTESKFVCPNSIFCTKINYSFIIISIFFCFQNLFYLLINIKESTTTNDKVYVFWQELEKKTEISHRHEPRIDFNCECCSFVVRL